MTAQPSFTGDWPYWIPPDDPNAYRFVPSQTAYDTKPPPCPYCGGAQHNGGICHLVKAIEYFPDGTIKRVELR
jgi:hypothetical protein